MFLENQKTEALTVIEEKLQEVREISKILQEKKEKYTKNLDAKNIGIVVLVIFIVAWLFVAPYIVSVLSRNIDGFSDIEIVATVVLYLLAVYPILYGIRELLIMPRLERIDIYKQTAARLEKRIIKMSDKVEKLFSDYSKALEEKRFLPIQETGNIDRELEILANFAENAESDSMPALNRMMLILYFTLAVGCGIIGTIYAGTLLADVRTDDALMAAAPVVFLGLFGGLHLIWIRKKWKINLISYLLSIATMFVSVLFCMSGEAMSIIILAVIMIVLGRLNPTGNRRYRVKNDATTAKK